MTRQPQPSNRLRNRSPGNFALQTGPNTLRYLNGFQRRAKDWSELRGRVHRANRALIRSSLKI
jgi:hypothetical protein